MSPSSLARSSIAMGAGTLASRILGLVRNALLIAALGATASGAADAFNVANMLPTQLYNLIIGGVLNAILVPQIVRALRQRNGEELVNRLLTAAAAIIAAITAVLTVASPLVIMLYASGLGRWQPLAYAFAFWCMPQVFFYGLYALWGQVLNARHSFGPYMWSPVLNNIISIASILAYLHLYGGYAAGQDPAMWDAGRITLVGGCATLGIAVQALVLYLPLRRSGFRPRFIWGVRGLGLGDLSKVATWALLGTVITALGDLAATNLGSRAVTAAESAEYAHVIVPSTTMYANALMIYMLPQSLVTTSIITALFTRMSEKAAAGNARGVRDDLSLGLRSVGVFTMLFAAGIATLAAPALQLFVPSLSLAQAVACGPVLALMAVGIPFQGAWFTLQRVLLAYGDTKRLLRADIVLGTIAVASCVLAWALTPAQYWMAIAAAGNTVGLAAASLTILPLLRRHLPSLDGRRVLGTYLRLLLAALPAVLVGLGVRALMGPADGSLTGTRAVDAGLIVLVAALAMTLIYLGVARLLRVSELRVVFNPASKIVLALASRLPGGAGERVARFGRALALPTASLASAPKAGAAGVAGFAAGAAGATGIAGAAAHAPKVGARSSGARQPGRIPPRVSPAQVSAGQVRRPARGRDGVGNPSRPSGTSHGLPKPGISADRIGASVQHRTREGSMSEGTPIGSGRYRLRSPLPTTLPRIVRHTGSDSILDREVTILSLTDVTPRRAQILEAASRAVLVDDRRMQRVYDVESADPAFIVTEPTSGRPLAALADEGLTPAQARALIGEVAQVLAACARRDLHHLNLSPESVRVRPDGSVQVCGVGIEAAALGLEDRYPEPLAADQADAQALVELLYFALTGRWPGKMAGIPAAPTHEGAPVAPSQLCEAMDAADTDLDALVARTWGEQPPVTAGEVADALGSWDASTLAGLGGPVAPAPAPAPEPQGGGHHHRPVKSVGSTGKADVKAGMKGSTKAGAAAGKAAAAAGLAGAAGAAGAAASEAADGAAEAGAGAGALAAARGALSSAGTGLGRAWGSLASGLRRGTQGASEAVARVRDRAAAEKEAPTAAELTEELHPASPAPSPGQASAPGQAAASAMMNDPQEEETSRAVSRTTATVLIVAVITVLIGVFFAATNLLQLANVELTDDDVPAAKTVPTFVATESPTPAPDDTTGAGKDEPAAAPISISGAQALDPFGDNNEHPELAPALIDGDASTTWMSRYYASSSLAWKQGLGVAVTLASEADISGIDLAGTGQGGHVQIRATSPEDPEGGTPLAEGGFTEGTTSFTFTPTKASSIVVWVTELPTDSEGVLRATISEITLR